MEAQKFIKSLNGLRKQIIDAQRTSMLLADDLEMDAVQSGAIQSEGVENHNALASAELARATQFLTNAIQCTIKAKAEFAKSKGTSLDEEMLELKQRRQKARERLLNGY